jgi:putative SOS response-associated peptidase YedK
MTLTTTEGVVEDLGLAAPGLFAPRYNIAPTQPLLVVANRRERALEDMRWGLVPSWAKELAVGSKMINARRESLADKPAFRDAYTRRRCLVLADGFYEWKREGKRSSPFYYHRRDRRGFAFAGLWERWKQPDGQWLLSATVITTDPNPLLAPIHDRMPVILAPADYDRWLSPEPLPPGMLDDILMPAAPADYELYPVSALVNSPENDSPQCVVEAQPIQGSLF